MHYHIDKIRHEQSEPKHHKWHNVERFGPGVIWIKRTNNAANGFWNCQNF